MLTADYCNYFDRLYQSAQQHNQRIGVYLCADLAWSQHLLQQWLASLSEVRQVQLGGYGIVNTHSVPFNQGQRLLGQECDLLVCDLSSGFDANSFSAVLGTLVGGGLLFVLGHQENPLAADNVWLTRALRKLLVITPNQIPPLPDFLAVSSINPYQQQQAAVSAIVRVVTGHRKRPLLLTADRGRGKSSALGIAAAQLMQLRPVKIIITAPHLSAVSPVFQFTQHGLPDSAIVKKNSIVYQESELLFMAPDEVYANHIDCDLLFVDEAAALPLPFLYRFVDKYHRAVFSSTIHGYEGCGRGFTLKFQQWLIQERPQMRHQHLEQPIRWSDNDPLEYWHRDAFLLNFDLVSQPGDIEQAPIRYQQLTKSQLLAHPQRLKEIFSLLVNAHYQTSPNDLFHLLSDQQVSVYIATMGQHVIACLLAVQEGPLEDNLIEQVQLGLRRPRGQLTPITLANQLGVTDAARQTCWRIMRIAVHPEMQLRGIGSQLLSHFINVSRGDYVSTSFGATEELIAFWQANQFSSVKLGSQRDQASGCYSLLMVHAPHCDWLEKAKLQFAYHLSYELKASLSHAQPSMIAQLLKDVYFESRPPIPRQLLQFYSQGGSNYESVAVWIEKIIFEAIEQQAFKVDELLIAKVVQQRTWSDCAMQYGFTGRKQTEAAVRASLSSLLSDLHCKSDKE